jgi:hypothetical protein
MPWFAADPTQSDPKRRPKRGRESSGSDMGGVLWDLSPPSVPWLGKGSSDAAPAVKDASGVPDESASGDPIRRVSAGELDPETSPKRAHLAPPETLEDAKLVISDLQEEIRSLRAQLGERDRHVRQLLEELASRPRLATPQRLTDKSMSSVGDHTLVESTVLEDGPVEVRGFCSHGAALEGQFRVDNNVMVIYQRGRTGIDGGKSERGGKEAGESAGQGCKKDSGSRDLELFVDEAVVARVAANARRVVGEATLASRLINHDGAFIRLDYEAPETSAEPTPVSSSSSSRPRRSSTVGKAPSSGTIAPLTDLECFAACLAVPGKAKGGDGPQGWLGAEFVEVTAKGHGAMATVESLTEENLLAVGVDPDTVRYALADVKSVGTRVLAENQDRAQRAIQRQVWPRTYSFRETGRVAGRKGGSIEYGHDCVAPNLALRISDGVRWVEPGSDEAPVGVTSRMARIPVTLVSIDKSGQPNSGSGLYALVLGAWEEGPPTVEGEGHLAFAAVSQPFALISSGPSRDIPGRASLRRENKTKLLAQHRKQFMHEVLRLSRSDVPPMDASSVTRVRSPASGWKKPFFSDVDLTEDELSASKTRFAKPPSRSRKSTRPEISFPLTPGVRQLFVSDPAAMVPTFHRQSSPGPLFSPLTVQGMGHSPGSVMMPRLPPHTTTVVSSPAEASSGWQEPLSSARFNVDTRFAIPDSTRVTSRSRILRGSPGGDPFPRALFSLGEAESELPAKPLDAELMATLQEAGRAQSEPSRMESLLEAVEHARGQEH